MALRPIKVNAKTLAHISSGLYRSTSGALKELVSNSFDANATKVSITTNAPSFNVFTCSDNGMGITEDQFEQLMDGGIGFSLKRKKVVESAFGRPMIGRLGIGLLSMTQLSHGFRVISHHKESKSAFKADVQITDYLLSEIDAQSDYGKQAEIGKFDISEIPFEASRCGVTIVSSQMRTGLIHRFEKSKRTDLPMRFGTFINQIQRNQSVLRLGPYWDLVWGLSIYCPIKYLPRAPVTARNVIREIRNELEGYSFDLTVDGMPVRKAIRYPTPDDKRAGLEYFVKSFKYDRDVEGRRLNFSGYLYAQEGKSIVPVEHRGLLVRIRNVAIGGFDKTFLNYEIAEGPRFGWISGEIYVFQGLEDALNVDRDSFNVSHPHYIRMREVIHSELKKVFSDLYRGIKRRSHKKRATQTIRRRKEFLSDIEKLFERRFKIERVEKINSGKIVNVNIHQGSIQVSESFEWPTNSEKRQFAEQILITWELARAMKGDVAQEIMFTSLYQKVLSNFKRW